MYDRPRGVGTGAGVDGTKPILGEVVLGEVVSDGAPAGSTIRGRCGVGCGFGFNLTGSRHGGSGVGRRTQRAPSACPALRIEDGFRGFGG